MRHSLKPINRKGIEWIVAFILIFVPGLIYFPAFAHEGHSHRAPWNACSEASKDEQCAYTNGNGDLFQGTCRFFNRSLMCVRNRPIVRSQDIAVSSGDPGSLIDESTNTSTSGASALGISALESSILTTHTHTDEPVNSQNQ